MNTSTQAPKAIDHCTEVKRTDFGSLTVWEGVYEYRCFPEAKPEITKHRMITEGDKAWVKIYTGTLYGSSEHNLCVTPDHDDAEEGWSAWDSIAQFDRMVKEAKKLKVGLEITEYHKGDRKRGKKGKFVTLAKS